MFIEIIRPFEELHTISPDQSRAHLNSAAYRIMDQAVQRGIRWGGDPGTCPVRIGEVGAGRTRPLWARRGCCTRY